jgi:hypothetical protein
MNHSGGEAGGYAAMIQAVKASGAIVKVKPDDFQMILGRTERPVVVTARGRFLAKGHKYLVSYGGLFFYTRSATPLQMPSRAEVIEAQSIWVPS